MSDRNDTIKTILEAVHDHLQGLTDNEWTQAQNNGFQRFKRDDLGLLNLELKVQTAALQRQTLEAMAASTVKPFTGPQPKTRDLATEAAAVNAAQPTGVPFNTTRQKPKFPAPEVEFDSNAETVTAKDKA